MVTLLALLGVFAILVAVALLSTREEPLLADAPRDAADVPLPDGPLSPDDVARLRFSLAPRGYRMSEVDLALERLGTELADRDRRIALLEAAAEGAQQHGVREATPADLPVTPPPAPAPGVQVEPVEPVAAPTAPAEVPQEPAPLPAADLGTELLAEDAAPAVDESAATPATHEDTGAAAATTDVAPDTLLAALEETGDRPHQQ